MTKDQDNCQHHLIIFALQGQFLLFLPKILNHIPSIPNKLEQKPP